MPSTNRRPAPGRDHATAAEVRARLQLTPHQLGELTSRLALDVGPRRNYPAYSPAAVDQLVACTLLRQCGVPLAPATRAVRTYAEVVTRGSGWLVLAPAHGPDTFGDSNPAQVEWSALHAMDADNLARLTASTGGRAVVLDLTTARSRAIGLRVGLQAPTQHTR